MSDTYRRGYKEHNVEQEQAIKAIKNTAEILEAIYDNMPSRGREQALAKTKLEESVMWAVKGVTA